MLVSFHTKSDLPLARGSAVSFGRQDTDGHHSQRASAVSVSVSECSHLPIGERVKKGRQKNPAE